jgi:hypothetical protein
MKMLEIPATVPERVQFLLQPMVVESERRNGHQLTESARLAWQRIIDGTLGEWQRDLSQLDDEGLEPPAREILSEVVKVAMALRDRGVDPPLRVLPNGEGGVVFEWRDNTYLSSLEMEKGGSLTLSVFSNSRLVSRHQLP